MRLFCRFMNIGTEFTSHSGYIVNIRLESKTKHRQTTQHFLYPFCVFDIEGQYHWELLNGCKICSTYKLYSILYA